MTKKMLINTIDEEESRMAVIEEGALIEFNIKTSVKEPTTGNIYKAVVQRVERGLRAAFVDYGAKKNGFLPLRDVSPDYFKDDSTTLPVGMHVLVQVLREEKDNKGAMLTTYISLPGRYLVLMPNRNKSGISRKIESEEDRKKLMELMEQICQDDAMNFIVRTAGWNRTKQELSRDYQMLLRMWSDLKQSAETASAPSLIYQESDFAVRALRDYYTSDIDEILVDDAETCRKMKAYCKTISPRTVRNIKLFKEETPIFDKFRIEDQIDAIYQERVTLKSGGYLIIEPTEALITIDVNSGRGSNRRDVEETAFRTNIEAAEEIARQLRLRDLGGLIVIDFIDMMDSKHIAEVERTFKNAMKIDRSRIQMSRISRFGLLELSRQRKQTAIQEVSYTNCPHCNGRGVRPSVEYLALNAFRKIKTETVKAQHASIKVVLPREVSDYLVNHKREEISKLERQYRIDIYITGSSEMVWGEFTFQTSARSVIEEAVAQELDQATERSGQQPGQERKEGRRRRPRGRRSRGARPGNDRDQAPKMEPENAPEPEQRQGGAENREEPGFLRRVLEIFR